MNGETPATENEGSAYAPRLRTYTEPTQLLAAGSQLTAHTHKCPELHDLPARVQAASYVAHYGDKTAMKAFDAQRPANSSIVGVD